MIPLYSSDQVRKADNYAINTLKIPSIALMENASRSIYEITFDVFPQLNQSHVIGIVCGKGNNGGDGFSLARHFINDGFKVNLLSLPKSRELSGDAKTNFDILRALSKSSPDLSITFYNSIADVKKLKKCYLIFDALLGTGAKGELREPYKKIVETLNSFSSYRIAIDTPTGLDLDKSTGSTIFNADLTITLAEFKSGLFYGKGYVHAGEIEKGYIGIGDEYFNKLDVENYLIEPEDAFIGLPIKKLDANKYSGGKVFTIAGSGKLPGAAVFAANAAILSGAGASVLAFPESASAVAQIKLDSAILESYDDQFTEYISADNIDELKQRIDWADSIALGPGLGREEETVEAVRELIRSSGSKKIVIDADGIYGISNKFYRKLNLKNKILTPHHGEFASLLGIEVSDLHENILKHGRNFVLQTGAYLVLKGAPTIIFTPNGDALINTTGNPGMATFGSGDVLSGIIASFIAQNQNLEEALISAVYVHGLAADLLLQSMNELGITAELILRNIPSSIKFLEDSFVKVTDQA